MSNTKVRSGKTFLVSLVFMCFCMACGQSNKNRSTTVWPNTAWYQLTQEMIKLRLPSSFKKTSRHRLKRDFPVIANDSVRLRMMQNTLEMLEIEDAVIDVFIDTIKESRIVIISNVPKFNISDHDFVEFKKKFISMTERDRIKNPTLLFSDVDAKMKSNIQHTLARYSRKVTNKFDLSDLYHSIYFLSGRSYSLMIYEFSKDEENVERCLWSTKEGLVAGK